MEITENKEIIVIGCIYKHPIMKLVEFNSKYLANFFHKNFLLKIVHKFWSEIFMPIYCNIIQWHLQLLWFNVFISLLAHITSPTGTTATSTIYLDNILRNNYNSPCTSGNLAITLFDHHAQFFILAN